MEEFSVTTYPEGWERVKEELLEFLPDDDIVKEAFMARLVYLLLKT